LNQTSFRGASRTRRAGLVDRILTGLEAIPITEDVARLHAEIWTQLVEQGQAIGSHDLWIAATAFANDLVVVARNARDFAHVPGLRVLAAA
jgi:tRNA(fMet)-specific endonuclease VapC